MVKTFECAVCGEHRATLLERNNEVTYKGESLTVPLRYYHCDSCKSEFSSIVTTSYNNRQMILAEKKADGMLTGDEIYKIRRKLNISQKMASELFGGGLKAFAKYEANEIKHNESMETLLRFFSENPEALKDLAKLKGVELRPKPISFVNFAWVLLEAHKEKMVTHKGQVLSRYKLFDVDKAKLATGMMVFSDKGTFKMEQKNASDDLDFELM